MPNNYFSLPDDQLAAWLTNFNTVAAANATPLGLDPAELTQISNAKTNFQNALNAKVAASATALAATSTKNQNRVTSLATIRVFVNGWYAAGNVSDNLLLQLGLVPHDQGGSSVPVFVPANLVCNPCNVTNKLQWGRAGNAEGTNFVIEQMLPGGQWTYLDSTTKTRYSVQDAVPGQQVSYRVYSQRGNDRSGYSNVVTAYGGGGGQQLQAA
ncbi:MAG: hypothetical protein IT207_01600 [Fimbriimonadaceae bacterium]|nr:hypothetical protein [Fimbriimonadaceae bacterium]